MPTFLQLHLELRSVESSIWRQVLAPPQLSLAELHELIQVSMGWGNYRSYRFWRGGEAWGPADLDQPGVQSATETTLEQWLRQAGSPWIYQYHMKHHWEVQITPQGSHTKRRAGPRLLGGAGNCPPEEVPGPAAYVQLLAAQQGEGDPADPYLAWLSDHFDPDAFDLKATRREVRQWFGGSAEVIALTTGLPVHEVAGLLRFFRDHLKDASTDLKASLSSLLKTSYEENEIDMPASDLPQLSQMQGGLSQGEMEILITAPFSQPSPLHIRQDLAADAYEAAPFYRLAHTFLYQLQQAGEWPLDEAKRLLPGTVNGLFQAEGAAWPDATQLASPTTEADFFPLAVAREVLQQTRLIRPKKRKAALTLTRKGRAALADPGQLFATVLEGFCRYYPWSAWDQAADDAIAQWGFGFSLLLLRQFGQEARPASYYAERYLRAMPALTGWDATEDPGAFREQFEAEFERYCARSFDFLGQWWGLVACPHPVSLISPVRATPLLLHAVAGAFPQGDQVRVVAPE